MFHFSKIYLFRQIKKRKVPQKCSNECFWTMINRFECQKTLESSILIVRVERKILPSRICFHCARGTDFSSQIQLVFCSSEITFPKRAAKFYWIIKKYEKYERTINSCTHRTKATNRESNEQKFNENGRKTHSGCYHQWLMIEDYMRKFVISFHEKVSINVGASAFRYQVEGTFDSRKLSHIYLTCGQKRER